MSKTTGAPDAPETFHRVGDGSIEFKRIERGDALVLLMCHHAKPHAPNLEQIDRALAQGVPDLDFGMFAVDGRGDSFLFFRNVSIVDEFLSQLTSRASLAPAGQKSVEQEAAETPWPECPITRRPFFMNMDHPEMGEVPTFGGPFDSYTIPYIDDDGDLRCEQYDHDAGMWIEGGEPLGFWLTTEQPCNHDLPVFLARHSEPEFNCEHAAPAGKGEAVLTHDQARDIATEILDGTHCPKHGMAWEECCLSEVSLELAVKIIKALRGELTAATPSSPAPDAHQTAQNIVDRYCRLPYRHKLIRLREMIEVALLEPRPAPDKGEVERLLDALTDDERLELFNQYCKSCGKDDPSCQCWNDE